ncbi:type II secretion system protein [Kiritimatiellaeota bacterium B1221]|nr:type II secretion system protein [Kiritimatiellaeota bacterium B1221]
MNKRDAFTLIEMLVVIAIIALLATMIIPVTGKVMERARIMQCSQNLRSIHMALVHYANDHDDTIVPPAGHNSKDNKRFGYYIRPYLEGGEEGENPWGVPERYRCPTAQYYPVNVHSTGLNPDYSKRPYLDFPNLAGSIMVADSRSAFSLFYSSNSTTKLHARHKDPNRNATGSVSAVFGDGHWALIPYPDLPDKKPWDSYKLLNPDL